MKENTFTDASEKYLFLLDLWKDGGRLHHFNGNTFNIEFGYMRYVIDNTSLVYGYTTEVEEAEKYFSTSGNVKDTRDRDNNLHNEFYDRILLSQMEYMRSLERQLKELAEKKTATVVQRVNKFGFVENPNDF